MTRLSHARRCEHHAQAETAATGSVYSRADFSLLLRRQTIWPRHGVCDQNRRLEVAANACVGHELDPTVVE